MEPSLHGQVCILTGMQEVHRGLREAGLRTGPGQYRRREVCAFPLPPLYVQMSDLYLSVQ